MLNKILPLLILGTLLPFHSFAQDQKPADQPADASATQYQSQSWRSAMRSTDKDWSKAKDAYEKTMANYYANVYAQQLYQTKLNDLDAKIEAQKTIQDNALKAQQAAQDKVDASKSVLNEKTKNELAIKKHNAEVEQNRLEEERKTVLGQLQDAQNTVQVFDLAKTQSDLDNAAKAANLNASVNDKKNINRGKKILGETSATSASPTTVSKLESKAKEEARDDFVSKHPGEKIPALPAKVVKKDQPVVPEKKVVAVDPDAASKALCAAWTGKDSKAGEQYACELGGVKVGAAALAQITATPPPALTDQAQNNAIFKAFLGRTTAQTCDDAGIAKACADLGTSVQKKVIVMFDSCSLEGDGSTTSAPLISAKEFCQGPVGTDGKATAFATLLGYAVPPPPPQPMVAQATCDQAYTEIAALIMKNKDNSKLLYGIIKAAGAQTAALAQKLKAGTLEDLSKQFKDKFAAKAADNTFSTDLTNLYLTSARGAAADAGKIAEKISNGKANYFDKNLTGKKGKYSNDTTRFKNEESSAFLFYLSQSDEYKSTFPVSYAAAVWAQGILYNNNSKYVIGDEASNKMNFSTQVYLSMGKNLSYKKGTRAPASDSKTPEQRIQDQVDGLFAAGSSPETDKLIDTINKGGCLKGQDNATACDKTSTKLGSESIEKIRLAVTQFASQKEVKGIASTYQLSNPQFDDQGNFSVSVAPVPNQPAQ